MRSSAMIVRVMLLVLTCGLPAFAGDGLDSLLQVQRERAGECAGQLFAVLDAPERYQTTAEEIGYLRFLIAYMPVSDLATVTGDDLLQNVRLADQARTEFPWGRQVSDELFRHFVLPYRVTQEPFVSGWRKTFFEELRPRVRKLSMSEAALEVNHWCHEKATYKASDSRDQDPLTTMRAGLGRCEEEMILTICALRAVGIPARQCYTPFWPHMDDNHAWVEAWSDGRWHYLGACEPEPDLNRAWFTNAAGRAMLVVSTAYGDYHGDEPVLRRTGRITLINSTGVYGPTHATHVVLQDHRGRPVPQAKVFFSLFNYGAILPAAVLETDNDGAVNLTCGLGDWFITAGEGKYAALAHVTSKDEQIVLRLAKPDQMISLTEADYSPPPERPETSGAARDSLFDCRLKSEDKSRESLWGTWAREAGVAVDSAHWRPDSLTLVNQVAGTGLDGGKLFAILSKARGNWGNLYDFLFGKYPGQETTLDKRALPADELRVRFVVLDHLTDKDARDFAAWALEDHFQNTTLDHPLAFSNAWAHLSAMDSTSRQRYEDYVITPRINYEPSRPWRQDLCLFFRANPTLQQSHGDKVLVKWLRRNLAVDKERDRLGPPLAPDQVLKLRRGTVDDIERLYVGLCRVRGIPARFDPIANRLQKWDNGNWQNVDLGIREKGKEQTVEKGELTIEPASSDSTIMNALYNREWGVQVWDTDHFSDVDFGFQTAFKDQKWPKELPVGLYCLTSGVRKKDGSVPLRFVWFEVSENGQARATLALR